VVAAPGGIHADLMRVAQPEVINPEEFIIRFSDVALFDVGEYSLRAEAERILQNVVEVLERYPDYIVIVEGHADTLGEEGYNQWLSERRSRVVADFLVDKGLSPYRIQVVGYGEARPVTTKRSPEGHQQNRRVELHIKKNGA
jgi:peptidoglycan-associated lipoprotein